MLVKKISTITILVIILAAVNCGSESGGTTTPGGATLPALTSADLDTTAPCPNQDLLTDQTFIDAAKAATTFTLLWNSSDTCNRDTYSLGTPTDVALDVTLGINKIQNTQIGVCGTTTPPVFGTTEFPLAGIYRRDFKFVSGATTYQVRVRLTVTPGSPDILGSDWTGLTGYINNLTDVIELYDENGTKITADGNTLKDLLIDTGHTGNYTVKNKSTGDVILNVKAEAICAAAI